MFGALVAGAAKVVAVAAVAVVANEVWQAVKPKVVEAGLSLFLEDNEGEEEDAQTGLLRQRAAEAAREAFPSLFPKEDAANV